MYKIIGALGLVLISYGILQKRKPQDKLFIGGGVLLEIYSISIGDPIFIILQLVFVISAIWDLYKAK